MYVDVVAGDADVQNLVAHPHYLGTTLLTHSGVGCCEEYNVSQWLEETKASDSYTQAPLPWLDTLD